VGESSFWYRPTRVVPDQRPLNGRCCCCCCAKYEVNFVFFCYYYAPAITTAHFSDPPYVYLASPAAASTPAGYMFYFCFLFFNDFGLTSYLKIYQTDLCLMFRVGRAMPSVL